MGTAGRKYVHLTADRPLLPEVKCHNVPPRRAVSRVDSNAPRRACTVTRISSTRRDPPVPIHQWCDQTHGTTTATSACHEVAQVLPVSSIRIDIVIAGTESERNPCTGCHHDGPSASTTAVVRRGTASTPRTTDQGN